MTRRLLGVIFAAALANSAYAQNISAPPVPTPVSVANGGTGGTTSTGSGAVVLATSPVLVTPALGTPASGVATNLTGTAAGLTTGTVTTNANLTGPITSSGNATAVAAQTGTGSTFVMNTSPVLVTPALGTPASGVATNLTGTATGLTAGTVTTNANLTGPITSSGNATAVAAQTGTGSTFVMNTSPVLVTPNIGASDVILQRDAAGALAQVNGANPQVLNIYNTSSSANANYERATIGFQETANALVIATRQAGTGAARNLTISSAGNLYLQSNGAAGPFLTYSTTGFLSPNTDNAVDLGIAAGNQFRSVYAKTSYITASGGSVNWASRSNISSPADGNFTLKNTAGTSFGLLQLGGTTSSFPAIKRNSAALNIRLADDSADAAVTAAGGTFSGALINTGITSDATHTDSSVCQDTTTHQFYSGSGTLGVCLGTSSARYKTGVAPLAMGLRQVMAFKPVTFRYVPGRGDGGAKLQYGFLAEDVAEIVPLAVDNDDQGRPNALDWPRLIPILVKAIQEQQVEIDELKRWASPSIVASR